MAETTGISLNNSEWVIMECLWAESPQTVAQISETMKNETGWARSTTKTLLSRMEAKGYLHCVAESRVKKYLPAIERVDVAVAATESLINRVYHGSLGLMVNALADRRDLTQEDIAELRAILDKAEEATKNA